MGRGSARGQRAHPPQDYEICLGGGGSSSGVPKPARCPGRLPAPVRPTPATARNTQNAAVYCSPGENGGPQPERGELHTKSSPSPSTTSDLWAKTLLCCILPAFLPLKTWIWGAQHHPAAAAPRDEPRQDGGDEASGRGTGGQWKYGGHWGGAIEGQGALPAAAALPHKGLGDGRLRTSSISTAEVSPPPPSPDMAGGHKPRPEPTRAQAGVTAMRGRVRGTPRTPGTERNRTKDPPNHSQEAAREGGNRKEQEHRDPPRTPRGDSGRGNGGADEPGLGVPGASRGRRRCGIDPRTVPLGRAWGVLRPPPHRPCQARGVRWAGESVATSPPSRDPRGSRSIPAPTEGGWGTLTQPPAAPRPPGRETGGSPRSVWVAALPELLRLGGVGGGAGSGRAPSVPQQGMQRCGRTPALPVPRAQSPLSILVGAGSTPLP